MNNTFTDVDDYCTGQINKYYYRLKKSTCMFKKISNVFFLISYCTCNSSESR